MYQVIVTENLEAGPAATARTATRMKKSNRTNKSPDLTVVSVYS